jgi:hypothetical protein
MSLDQPRLSIWCKIRRGLIEVVPLSITIARETKGKTAYVRLFMEYVLIAPPLCIFYLAKTNLLQFVAMFVTSFVSLHSFYEIFYLLNDTWTVKREDYPAERDYVKEVNVYATMIMRALYFIIASLLLATFMDVPLLRLVVSTSILTLSLLIHNLQRSTLRRIATYPSLRIFRVLYIPITLLGINSYEVKIILIVLLPLIFTETVGYYWYLSTKAGKKIPIIPAPAYFWYGSFLLVQIPWVWPHISCLTGNLTIFLLSLLKNLVISMKLEHDAQNSIR